MKDEKVGVLDLKAKLNNIPKFHTKWQVREEEYRKIILTDTLKIHIIELPKLIKQLRKNKWNKKTNESFILNPENEGDENKNNKLEIAKKLLDLKMPIEQIIEITGLTEEEIKQLNK